MALRKLVLSPESLSASQFAELLDPSARPSVAALRAWLREHDGTLFVLGAQDELPG